MAMPRPHSTKPRSPFALRLVETRRAFGIRTGRPELDQKDFAAALGVEGETYRRYERGETEPKLATLARIREVTGTPLDWLICGIEDKARAAKPPLRVVDKKHQ